MTKLTIWYDPECEAVVIHGDGGPGSPCLIIEPDFMGDWLEALTKAAFGKGCDPEEAPGRFNVVHDD